MVDLNLTKLRQCFQPVILKNEVNQLTCQANKDWFEYSHQKILYNWFKNTLNKHAVIMLQF